MTEVKQYAERVEALLSSITPDLPKVAVDAILDSAQSVIKTAQEAGIKPTEITNYTPPNSTSPIVIQYANEANIQAANFLINNGADVHSVGDLQTLQSAVAGMGTKLDALDGAARTEQYALWDALTDKLRNELAKPVEYEPLKPVEPAPHKPIPKAWTNGERSGEDEPAPHKPIPKAWTNGERSGEDEPPRQIKNGLLDENNQPYPEAFMDKTQKEAMAEYLKAAVGFLNEQVEKNGPQSTVGSDEFKDFGTMVNIAKNGSDQDKADHKEFVDWYKQASPEAISEMEKVFARNDMASDKGIVDNFKNEIQTLNAEKPRQIKNGLLDENNQPYPEVATQSTGWQNPGFSEPPLTKVEQRVAEILQLPVPESKGAELQVAPVQQAPVVQEPSETMAKPQPATQSPPAASALEEPSETMARPKTQEVAVNQPRETGSHDFDLGNLAPPPVGAKSGGRANERL